MAEKKTTAKKSTQTKRTSAPRNSASSGFTAEERAAMKALAAERKAANTRAEGERLLKEAIAKMKEPDCAMAKRVHAIVMAAAPDLAPKTWYGMPAWAKDDKVLCFFQDAQKFKSRYGTFGFSDEANLDAGGMWPTSFALMELTSAEEAKLTALVKKAMR